MIKISIIIPIHNAEKYLDKCLESVINQTFEDIEIICINDGSSDNSIQILKEYVEKDKRIKIINQNNKGVSAARNEGLKVAQGDYICFVDADDWLDKKMLLESKILINKNQPDIIICDIFNVYNNSIVPTNRLHHFILKNKIKEFKFSENKEICYQSCAVWAKLFKKDFLIQNNLNFVEGITHGEDTIFWLSCLSCNPKLSLIDKYLYYYFKNSNGASANVIKGLKSQYKALIAFKSTKYFLNSDTFTKLLFIDYFARLAVYNYSSVLNFNNFINLEFLIFKIVKQYKTYNLFSLLKLKGFQLYLIRWLYAICKHIVLFCLKNKYKQNII